MPTRNESGAPDSGDLASRVATLVVRFEDAWQRGQRPAIADYLPADGPERRAALIELVHVDLERRLKAGESVRVEAYLSFYPELADDPVLVVDLLAAEWTLRRRQEPQLSLDEYRRRFLQHGAALEERWQVGADGGEAA